VYVPHESGRKTKVHSMTDPSSQALVTDDSTWLRGMWPTDANGATSFNSIVPGFYVRTHPSPTSPHLSHLLTTVQIGRTLHIHVQVHTNWTITKNGTIDHSRVVETGQIYFDEKLTEELMAVEPYASHTQIERVENDEDGVFLQQVQCMSFLRFEVFGIEC
jgi:protocatechuate 3,4-dioxygenase beta subunit